MELTNKVAIITGGSSGIGASIAKSLAKQGVKVVLTGRNEVNLKQVAGQVSELSQTDVVTEILDVTSQEAVESVVSKVKQQFGSVDILVNSAGQMLSSAITEGNVAAWDTMIDVNVKGTLYGINAVLPTLLEQSEGILLILLQFLVSKLQRKVRCIVQRKQRSIL